MQRQELARIISSAALGLSLAACGGHEQNNTPATSETTSTTSTTSTTTSSSSATTTANGPLTQLEDSGALPKLDRSASLAGPDVDGNGVRDDIDAYINGKFTHPRQRRAVLQDARAMQTAVLVDPTDIAATKAISLNLMAATNCLFAVFPDGEGLTSPESASRKIEAITSNTKARLLAYLAYNKSLDGSVGSIPAGDTCE